MIDEVVLLSNSEHISLEAKLLESCYINTSNAETLATTHISEYLRVLIKYFLGLLDHGHIVIAERWTQNFVNRSKICEIQNACAIEITSVENVLDVLQLL